MDAHHAPGTIVIGHQTLRTVLGRIFVEAGSDEAETRAVADHRRRRHAVMDGAPPEG